MCKYCKTTPMFEIRGTEFELKPTAGFKKCKKPYDMCYYLCFARGVQYMFLSPVMLDIKKWEDDDPRIHKKANCRYKDRRTALEFMCELVKEGYVSLDYLERKNVILHITERIFK